MKRVLSFFLVCAALLSFCACGAQTAAESTAAPISTKPAPTIQVVEGQPIEQLDDVSVYIPANGKTKELEGLPSYTYSEGETVAFKGMKEVRYGQRTFTLNNTDAASFITYLQALEADGWQQYSNNIIEGTNLFATYTKDERSIYCYYISSKNRTSISLSPCQNLEVRKQDNQYEAVCAPLLTQIDLTHATRPNGMSYVIRLSDGRFVIVDGGYHEANFTEAIRLHDTLTEQNVLDKITIAAWIITHPHRDHLATASDFLRYYNPNQVAIQQFIFNFPTDDAMLETEPVNVTDTSSLSRTPTFLDALETLWPEVPVTVCHTGQRYYFADAEIEILHTVEDFFPHDIIMQSQDPVNGASVVFTVELAGQRIMFLGDSAVDCSKDTVKMWGSYLKSDIMQAAHHGLNGGSVALYEAIDPAVVMVPGATRSIKNIVTFKHSRWIWNNESGNIQEVIFSDFSQRVLELPYTPAADVEYFSNATSDPWAGYASKYQTN